MAIRQHEKQVEQFQDRIARLYPELSKVNDSGKKTLSRVVTFQVTDECNLACTYCYQINKGRRKMKFETAKKLIDMLLDDDPRLGGYINPEVSPGLIIEFIGGEPLLNIELIDQISSYFFDQAIEKRSPWLTKFAFSICSNGVLYFDKRVQDYLTKWSGYVSFSITIDGSKELHDACRVFPDGSPSYDLAVAAAKDWMRRGYLLGSKITIAPGNLTMVADSIKNMIALGYDEINANCVYEEGWEPEHATEFYWQLKEIADYLLTNDLVDSHYISLFVPTFFKPKDEDDLDNWCFRAGTMITTPDAAVPIESINIDDYVISGKGNCRPVEDVKVRVAKDTCILHAEGMETTYTTLKHPYLTMRKNGDHYEYPSFISAGELKPGDLIKFYPLATDSGKVDNLPYDENYGFKWIPVTEIERYAGEYEVYNLTVADDHSFIANGAIVHNCGGTGYMLAMDPDGYLYPCIRYMESSLGDDRPPIRIGHVDEGIGQTKCTHDCIDCLNAVDRRTQSTDECFYCPIADGCSWCSAYNYQVHGTVDKRATFICEMHKARALANVYLWNSWYRKNNMNKRFEMHCPEEWALKIIPREEYELLKRLEVVDYDSDDCAESI